MSRGGGDGGYDRRTVLASVLGAAATPAVSGVGGATDGTAAAVGRGSATEWSMHRADAANTAANRAGGTVEPPLAERWRSGPLFSFGRRVVSTDGRRVFVTNRGPDDARFSLRARSAADGALQWEFAPADGTVTGTPAVARDAVFAGGDALYAVAAEDGSEQFRFDAGGDVGIPVVADGTVLVAADGTLRAVDAATGDEQWQFDAGGPVRSPPSVATGTAYLGIDDGRVVALDLETGAVEWRAAAPGRRTAVVGNAVVANDREDLAVLAASDGGVRWRLDPPRSTVVTAPVVAGGQVYVQTGSIAIDWDDGVHAFDLATGRRRWRRDVGVDPLFVRAATLTLALGGGTLYVGGLNGGLTALQATTGATRFSFGVDEPVIVSPVVARDGLYLVGAPNAAAPGDAGFVLAVAGRGGGRRSTTAG